MLTRWSEVASGLQACSCSLELLLLHRLPRYPWKLPVLQLTEVLSIGKKALLWESTVGNVPGLCPWGISKTGLTCLKCCLSICSWSISCLGSPGRLQLLRTLVTGLGVLTALLLSEGLLLDPEVGEQDAGLSVLSWILARSRHWRCFNLSSSKPSWIIGPLMTSLALPLWECDCCVLPLNLSFSIFRSRPLPFFDGGFSGRHSSLLKVWCSLGDGGLLEEVSGDWGL